MTTLEIAPMQWGNLLDIEDVEPLNPTDYECLAEVRDVLKKHGKRERFGVALLHKHFDLAEGETMMEATDKEARVLTIRPVTEGDLSNSVETIWMLHDGEFASMMGCQFRCGKDIHGNHMEYHTQT
jgi:hypothetical protein